MLPFIVVLIVASEDNTSDDSNDPVVIDLLYTGEENLAESTSTESFMNFFKSSNDVGGLYTSLYASV